MKFAILSDIHGNYSALCSVIFELKAEGIENIICLGDIAGYYYDFSKCLSLLNDFNTTFIMGNHDEMLKKSVLSDKELKEISLKYGLGCKFALDVITSAEIDQLNTFVDDYSLTSHQGKKHHFSHSNPWGDHTHVYENSGEGLLSKFDDFDDDFFFIGHSHYQFILNRGDKKIISVGSVGQNRKEGAIACWATLSGDDYIELRRTKYDITDTLNMIDENDPNVEYLKKVLLR